MELSGTARVGLADLARTCSGCVEYLRSRRRTEAALRERQLDDRLAESVTYWHSYVVNLISLDYNIYNPRIPSSFGPPYGEYVNSEAERSQGVELEAICKGTPRLTPNGSYTRTDAYINQPPTGRTLIIENASNMGNLGLTGE